MKTILVTGGAGFIGTHTDVELLNKGYQVIVIDNFVNASPIAIERVEKITGKKVKLYTGDCRDRDLLEKIFTENQIDGIIHFAGLKAVGESVEKPLLYFENNLDSTLALLDVMKKHNVRTFIFSSSATVYGTPERLPLDEECRLSVTNPYGRTKLFIEQILQDVYRSDNSWNMILLRYFNPVGAHPSGLIGENPRGIPNNLMPYISQVAMGRLKELHVFGNDYPTKDGTGVRDYIHVMDLAAGHISAFEYCTKPGVHIYNLGTGIGYSVLDIVHAFEKASGKKVPYVIDKRRAGDVAACYASPKKAYEELHWKAKYNLEDMCRDQWNWVSHNPEGYTE